MTTTFETFELTLVDLSDIINTAARLNLPKPDSLGIVSGSSMRVFITFADVADLNRWAEWCDVPVGRSWFTATQDEHRAEATVLGVKVHLQAHTARVDVAPAPKPGDLCRFLVDGKAEHDATCPDYPAGTVTDVRTGKVVAR